MTEPVQYLSQREKLLRDALRFIRDLATEEYQHTIVGTGVEVCLRHIIRRANDTLKED